MAPNRSTLFPQQAVEHSSSLAGEMPTDTTSDTLTDPRSQRRRDLQACIARLLELNRNIALPIEKRAQRRYAFRKPLVIIPIDNTSGKPDRINSFAAFGIDISPTGICFLARHLLRVRRAVTSCEGPGNETVNLLLEPRWVRFTRGGWYQTGGRLLEVLDLPAAQPVLKLWDELARDKPMFQSYPDAPPPK